MSMRGSGFCNTARQFFSKDNLDHPSIEENRKLKQQLEHLRQVKTQSMGVDESTVSEVNQDTIAIRSQLNQYKNFVDLEKHRFLELQAELHQEIHRSKTELNSNMINTRGTGFSINSENVEEMRQELAQTSIELEEQRERYKRQVAKGQKDLELNYQQLDAFRQEEKKQRVKIN